MTYNLARSATLRIFLLAKIRKKIIEIVKRFSHLTLELYFSKFLVVLTNRFVLRLSLFHSHTQLWVGVMLTTQPFFIGGIEDVDNAQRSAFGACFMFLFTFVVSAIGMVYDSTAGKKATAVDEDGIVTDYQLAGSVQEYPNYGTST